MSTLSSLGITRADTEAKIQSLVHALVHIQDENGAFLLHLEDGRIIDTMGFMTGWEWTHGIGLYGLFKLYQLTNNSEALDIALEWFRVRLPQGTTKNVNTVAPFLTAAYLHEEGHAKYEPYLNAWCEWVMHDMPRTPEGGLQHMTYVDDHDGQLWDDTLMMTVLPLAKVGLVLNRPSYVEEAKRQFLIHIKYLSDVETGLWFHGWTFNGRHHFARARWARGNCWVTIAIPDFIELLALTPSSALYQFLVSTLQSQIDALLKYQDKSGLWHTLLDDPTSYLEASSSAGFAYGILKALRLRLITGTKYVDAVHKAIAGVFSCISNKGELERTSFGTPVFKELQDYKDIPITPMPYGQALGLLALTEFLRTFF